MDASRETGRSPESDAERPSSDPEPPAHLSVLDLRARITPAATKILACSNPSGLSDMRETAERFGIAFEKEE